MKKTIFILSLILTGLLVHFANASSNPIPCNNYDLLCPPGTYCYIKKHETIGICVYKDPSNPPQYPATCYTEFISGIFWVLECPCNIVRHQVFPIGGINACPQE